MAQLSPGGCFRLMTIFAALEFSGVGGEQAGKQGAKSMIEDPYFNRLGIQLIHCPESSAAALTGAAKGNLPPTDKGAAFPVVSAKSWVQAILAPPYSQRESTVFLPFRQENGLYDVVRAFYTAQGQQIEIAQSLNVISIVFKTVPVYNAGNLARAGETARKFLQIPGSTHFGESGAFENGTFGRQILPPGPPAWPFWVDELRWWSSGGDVGFLTLKAAGGPTQTLISASDGLNLHWFN